MPFRIKRTNHSRCLECPLRDRKKVWGLSSTPNPKIAIIGEAPGKDEDLEGAPFIGKAGKFFIRAATIAGLKWNTTYKTNVISCRPPGNKIDSSEAVEALQLCKKGFIHEVKALQEAGVKVFILAGNTAMRNFGIDGTITKNRGSVFICKILPKTNQITTTNNPGNSTITAVPTYHPSFIMRGQFKEEVTWVNDLEKAKNLAKTTYKPPTENFNIYPTLEDIKDLHKMCLEKKPLLGVDVEASSLNTNKAKLYLTGIATSPSDAISLPLFRGSYKDGPYWKMSQELKVSAMLKEILKECPLIFQNALYDKSVLRTNGYFEVNVVEDSMLKHHAIHPELRHDIGYIVSIYGNTPYWKDNMLSSIHMFLDNPVKERRIYNLRDACVLLQINQPLEEHLKEVGTEKIYRGFSLKLIDPIIEMQEHGMLIDKKKLASFKRSLTKETNKQREIIFSLPNIHSEINLDSDDDLRYLFFGTIPNKYKKACEVLKTYNEPNCKKSKNTKVYKNNLLIKAIFDNTKPLYKTRNTIKQTDGGKDSVSEQVRLSILIAANNRREEISNLKKQTTNHKKELQEVKNLITFIAALNKYIERTKLKTTYTNFPVSDDGRVHFSYRIHGTATGRLASGNKKRNKDDPGNAQNIPEEARKIFVSKDGYSFVAADHSNLEVGVLAYICGDKYSVDLFESGVNVHDVNTKDLLGLTPEDPNWKRMRKAMKTYRFRCNYLGGLRGALQGILIEDPGCGLTMSKLRQIDSKYMSLRPGYKKWVEKEKIKIKATRKSVNGFGRVRHLLGTPNEIIREGINNPIQGTAADIVNTETIMMHKLKKKYNSKAVLVLQKHDELMYEVKDDLIPEFCKLLKKVMEQTYTINEYKCKFPISIEVGKSWGELKEWSQ